MNIVKTIDQYKDDNVYFCDPIKNNIMADGRFIRILYSTSVMILNGIYLFVPINECSCDKYYNKYRCMFNTNTHQLLIEQLKTIEENILKKIVVTNKIAQLKINEQFTNGNIKVFEDICNKTECSFVLKISGVWETQCNYGLTYKFFAVK
jgi:hypothetical protein